MDALSILRRRVLDADSPSPNHEVLADILNSAAFVWADVRFPFGGAEFDADGVPVVEARYHGVWIDIAIEIYNKIGAEGQTAHREGGIDRYYASTLVSPDLLRRITPYARAL